MKILIKLFSFILALSVSGHSFAATAPTSDAYSNYYTNEGRLLLKLSGMGVSPSSKQTNFSPTPTGSFPVDTLFKMGYGAEAASAVFFTDNFAAEINLGVYTLQVKHGVVNNVAQNYGSNNISSTKKRDVYAVPLSLIAQYHIAPFGGVRPFVGAGYSGTFLFTQAKEFKLNNASGFVFQAGVDLVAKDDTLITFNVKKYLLKTKVTYDDGFTGARGVNSKVKIDPFTFSIGIGFSM